MLNTEQKIYFRDLFRAARYKALLDAEDFDVLFHAIETFGALLSPSVKDISLGHYETHINEFVKESIFYKNLPNEFPAYHSNFSFLYEEVRKFRNESAHQGVHARAKTRYAVELCLIIESKLNEMNEQVSNYMVRSPLIVTEWEPLSHVRKEMLINSFSHIPVFINQKWQFISDFKLLSYLKSKGNQQSALRESISTAYGNNMELTAPAYFISEKAALKEIKFESTIPVLIHSDQDKNRLVGILTSFDLI